MVCSLILLLVSLSCVGSTTPRQHCDASKFSCEFNDPCDPQCVPGQHQYPGRSPRVHIECVEGRCTEQQCPRRTTWNQASQQCEGENGLEARCTFGKFDCEARNPCTPILCEEGVENYPGPSPRRYVTCAGGCSEAQCPRRQVWDQEKQRCVRKTTPVCPDGQIFDETMLQCVDVAEPGCRWQEMSVSTSVEDCLSDFQQRPYSDNERGIPHHDGLVDCTAASGKYYVEDYTINGTHYMFMRSCHPSTGLCFNLASKSNGGWLYQVHDITGPNMTGDFIINEILSDLDHEVPESCVEMATIAQDVDYIYLGSTMDSALQEYASACYNMGGNHSYNYGRFANYIGICTDRIPCDKMSTDSVTIYQFTCE